MYNDPSGADTLEFIEIFNNDTTPVSMAGYAFTAGVTYLFPAVTINAGTYFILAKDSVKTNAFFGTAAYQWTSGGLSNGGETILLKNNTGDTVDIVTFDDGGQWPSSADGSGPSLTLCDPNLNNNVAANWAATTTLFGSYYGSNVYATPGAGCPSIVLPSDTIAPIVLSASALNDTTVVVTFNEMVDTTAVNINNYSGVPSIASADLDATSKIVTLDLSTALVANQTYNLTISNVKDTAQNVMLIAQTFPVVYTFILPNLNPNLVITEIMYNGPESGSDTTEFIEIYNNDTVAVNLAGLSFTQGVVYTFPSVTVPVGGYFVVAYDSVKVNNFFNINAYKWTSGGLSNNGEDICLVNSNNDTIDYVDFKTVAPWPTAANGTGPSLNLCNPNLDNSLGSNWSAANTFVGVNSMGTSIYANPGVGCSFVVITDTVPPVVNSVQATTATTVEVEFNEAIGGSGTNTANYTGLGSISTATIGTNGQTVELSLASPLSNGQTYTLTISAVQDTAGNPMAAPQSFQINYNASTSSLIITEIMYNDLSEIDSLEYFEIYNDGTSAADLSGYAITDGIVYTFPAGTTLAAGDYLVIAKDSALVNSVFNISGTHQWISGGLKNSGENIEIQNSVGTVIDLVGFSDVSPWPIGADGGGASLEFCDKTLDNNVGSNWTLSETFVGIFLGDTIFGSPGSDCSGSSIQAKSDLTTNIHLFPNPATEQVTINNQSGLVKMRIYDMKGSLVKEVELEKGNTTVSISDLKSGMYYVQYLDIKLNRSAFQKLIIQ
jgi:hypothetical protein